MAYKQKGFPMHSTASALKHGDGTWGGSPEEPAPIDPNYDPLGEDVVEGKRVVKYKPLNQQDYPFNSDQEFAELVAKNKARFGVE